jgi:hypothetical protein
MGHKNCELNFLARSLFAIPECTQVKIATGAHQLLACHAFWRVRQHSEIQISTLNASVRYFDYHFGSTIHEPFRAKRT